MIDILELQTIYAKLQDELSCKIFVNRLLYSIIGDKKYIENIAMEKPINRKFKLREISRQQIIERVNKSNKPVIMYGAGIQVLINQSKSRLPSLKWILRGRSWKR